MDWHVLFTKTGYEQKVADEIANNWRVDGIKPFIPMYDVKFRTQGKVIADKRRLFPGYVFIESEIGASDFWNATRNFIGNSRHILALLRYGNDHENERENKHQAAITSNERQTLMKLFKNNDYHVGMSTGIIVGNLVRVTDGPLIGHESLIKKIKRHRMEAIIEVELMGAIREVTIGLEIVQRIGN